MDENIHQNEELLADISDLFLRYGLRSTSMDDIANHLKISKKTLYQQFANKDDVVEQVMLYRRRVRMVASDTKELEGLNPIEIVGRIRDFMVSDLGSRLPANYFDMKKYHPAVYQKIAEAEEAVTKDFLVKWLENGIKQKYFREDIDKELQLYLLSKQLHFLRDPNIVGQIEYPLRVIITTIFTNFVYAISTEKGIKEYERLKNNSKQVKDE
ncbi:MULTISPECIES: TetR/AcrR family transcriptional regulator [Butyricimonas]|uniref:TetR/AcrR family transcriptional regulator n=1 Tax=Butyricimonas TaxID=574697 RepID=UPI0003684DED|nr:MULTISPECIES: TetR/AcrR family transcriptional regulator [Butyricimonas]